MFLPFPASLQWWDYVSLLQKHFHNEYLQFHNLRRSMSQMMIHLLFSTNLPALTFLIGLLLNYKPLLILGMLEDRSPGECDLSSVEFSRSVMSDFATPWNAARQASLSITNSWSLLKLITIESVMPSNHLILCHPLLLLPSIFPSIRVFSQ